MKLLKKNFYKIVNNNKIIILKTYLFLLLKINNNFI